MPWRYPTSSSSENFTQKKSPVIMFTHNFVDDIGDQCILPWGKTTEGHNVDDPWEAAFVAPCQMHFHSIFLRTENLTGTWSYTTRIYLYKYGVGVDSTSTGWASKESMSICDQTISSDDDYTAFGPFRKGPGAYDPSGVWDKGELIVLAFERLVGSGLGPSQDWYFTTMWEVPNYREL
jgi:hypothetical protein